MRYTSINYPDLDIILRTNAYSCFSRGALRKKCQAMGFYGQCHQSLFLRINRIALSRRVHIRSTHFFIWSIPVLGLVDCSFGLKSPQPIKAQLTTKCSGVESDLSSFSQIKYSDTYFIHKIVRKIQRLTKTLWDAILVLIRTSEVAIRFSPLLILTPAAIFTSSSNIFHFPLQNEKNKISCKDQEHKSKVCDAAWAYTLFTVQKLGPVFIKLAQWFATRRDIFPENVCNRLSLLHTSGHAHSFSHTQRKILEAFGEDYVTKRLVVNEYDVIGSGSVAQVYRATLEDSTSGEKRKVAIKVLHPNIHDRTERDLLLLQRIAKLLDLLPSDKIKMLSLSRAIQTFSSIIQRQVDLKVEGDNLEKFRVNFLTGLTSNCIPKVSFPKPIMATANCLVEDLVDDASPIMDLLLDNTEKGIQIRREIAAPLLRAFLKMVFVDNFVHCDLHPGNVLVRRSRSSSPTWYDQNHDNDKYQYTIIFLDAGIVSTLKASDQQNLRDLFKAVILNDGRLAGRLMVERARYEQCSQTLGGIESFSEGIADIVSEFHDRRKQGLTLGVVRIGTLLNRVLDLW